MSTKRTRKNNEPRALLLPAIEYDPFMPGLSVLHRAGIAGLVLQIEAMKTLKEAMSAAEAAIYIIPKYEWLYDGRGIRISFSRESFYSLMRERYRGDLFERSSKTERKAKEEKPDEIQLDANPEDGTPGKPKRKKGPQLPRYVCKWPREEGRFVYLDPRPVLSYFEAFKTHEDWQNHTRDAAWNSYYCIYRSRLVFKLPSEGEKSNKVDELWKALSDPTRLELKKQYYPSAFEENLKGTPIDDESKTILLLHFWPLVASHFTPVVVQADKEKGRTILRNDWQAPVVVVPDVVDVSAFVDDFKDYLGALGNPPSDRLHEDGRKISSPLEAPLAFFAVPRIARGRNKIGTRGAEVYVFRKPRQRSEKQPVVSAIVNETLEPILVDEYRRLIQRKIFSLPFRAVCVQNLLAHPRQLLYEGFERLVDQYPLELFVATKSKDGGGRQFLPDGKLMARSLQDEFKHVREKEQKKMTGEERSIPFLIWRITQNYLRWRACNRADPPINESEMKGVLAKLARERDEKKLDSNEKALLGRYNAAMGKVVERAFIDFRGSREPTTFANAFSETLFRAPQFLGPRQAERLQPFYEGTDWESGRRLVLMAISATGANASPTARSQHAYEGEFDAALSTTIGGEND